MKYPVVETFQSIQGEGRYTGYAANFIRLAGCPNKCDFCDTDLEAHEQLTEVQIADRVNWELPLIVVTGGEPTIHDLVPLMEALRLTQQACASTTRLCLETSGVGLLPWGFDWKTVSPKQGKWIPLQNFSLFDEVKWLVPMWSLYDIVSARPAFPTKTIHFVQPVNEYTRLDKKNIQLATEYILKAPWLHLSIQLHKVIGVR